MNLWSYNFKMEYSYVEESGTKIFRNLYIHEICDSLKSLKTFDGVPIRKLLIANITNEMKHKELKRVFSFYGEIDNCILKTKGTDKKSLAFVTYKSSENAHKALEAGHKKKIRIAGQYLRVVPAYSWNQPDYIHDQIKINESFIINEEQTANISKNYDKIDVASIDKLNNDCLMHIFMYLPFLDRIKIERVCKRWRIVIKESWYMQKKLDLDRVHSNWSSKNSFECVYAPFIYKILLRCGSYLTHIDLSENTEMTGNAILMAIAKLCPNIQSFGMRNFNFRPSGIKALAKNNTKIKNFIITFDDLFHGAQPRCDDELSLLFSNNRKLETILINCSILVNGKCMLNLPTKLLRKVGLININRSVARIIFKVIQRLLNLQSLTIQSTNSDTAFMMDLSQEIIDSIPHLIHLKELNFERSEFVNDNFLIALSKNCKQLVNINISYCKHVSNVGLASITSLPKLERLNISGLKYITDEVLIDMPNLKILKCFFCMNIRNMGLITLIKIADNIELINACRCKCITHELINAAVEVTKNRKHKLKIILGRSKVGINKINESFLEVS